MEQIVRTPGLRRKILGDIIELNGFHEVTDRVLENITQPEWRDILGKHYPELDVESKRINVDLYDETIKLE